MYLVADFAKIHPPEMESPESSEADMKSESPEELVEELSKNSIEAEIEVEPASKEENQVFQVIEHEERSVVAHRAKAFLLNSESNDWEEMATGICSPEPSEVKQFKLNNFLFILFYFIFSLF